MNGRITRRRALAPLAALALASLALGPASAQPARPGGGRRLTAAQRNRLNAALRNLRAARAQVTAARLSANTTTRVNSPIETAIRDVEALLRGRVRP